jgi:CHAD domain-containing protein
MPPITTVQLDPVMRTEVAVATFLSAFHQVMNANEKGIVTDLDPEFLHDFRVAIRSSRALLTQAHGVFPKRYLARFKSTLAWLARATGPQRDLDVFLLRFEDYRAKLPHSVQDHLFPLRDFLLKCQWTEHRRLVRTLVSKRYLDFKRIYTEFLAGMATRRSRTAEGKRPALQAASQAIWRAYCKTTQEGQAITSDSPIEQLHKLRKTCKKLRYLLEAFQTLYPCQKIRNVIKELKRLQDGLGALVDLDVQC